MTPEQILKCPFCGEDAELNQHWILNGWFVACKNKKCHNKVWSDKKRAIDVWNTRTEII